MGGLMLQRYDGVRDQVLHPGVDRVDLLIQVVESISQAVVITDADNIIIYVNPAYERLTGFTAKESIGKRPTINKSGRHDDDFYAQMWQSLADKCEWEGEIWDRRADGTAYLKHLLLRRIADEDGNTIHHLAIFHDLSEKKQTEADLERLTHYDALTKLPNRLLFRNRLRHEFNVAARHKVSTGLILLNLDRFRLINESFGFVAGDQLLREVAERFTNCIRCTDLIAQQENRTERDPDMVSRMSGDAFSFILSEMRRPDDAGVVTERLLATLRDPFYVVGEEVYISASMGIAIYPQNAADEDDLLHCAELALEQVKREGRGGYRFFSDELNATSADRVRLEAQMRRAIAAEDFTLHYQLKVNLDTGMPVGVEALIRWQTDEGRMIPPGDFIPLAEDTGLINAIGEWTMHRAFADILVIARETGLALQVAVNLSARQFQHPQICETICQALRMSAVPPEQVELEITEGMLMHNAQEACDTMRMLRSLGVHLAIDDFGTGYSSLAYLRNFPVNTLKIDRSFVQDLTAETSDDCIIRAVIGLGQGLGLQIVAEGVETAEQMALLRHSGCHQAQGFFIARPEPLETVIARIRQYQAGDLDRPSL